jgi:nucleotide-binding universal stress UspA family protein
MARKITYFLILEEKYLNQTLKNPFILESGDEVNIVHIFERHVYFNELSSYSYPPADQEDAIKKSVLELLNNQKKNFEKDHSGVSVNTHCLFSHIPKETAVKFLEENNSDIAVVTTHPRDGLAGLFTSSFSDYLCRHSKSDVYVTRI